jgi:flagellar motility protein MotE (MotC chaperone)
MKRVRLLPIVIVAASGLLVLKATELVTSSGKFFAEADTSRKAMTEEDLPRFARALARHRFIPPAEADITGSVPPKKDDAKKDDAKKDDAKKADGKKEDPKAATKPEIPAQQLAEQRPAQPLPPVAPTSASERAVLERLQERRGAIDDRSRELDMRESLLQAAERKVDGRINEMKDIEGRIDAGAKAEQAEVDKQLRTVVVMYEAMKPKDAARVFDRLKLDVLVPIATAMKPARMSEILAVMSPEAAEKLTVAMATKPREGASVAAAPMPGGVTPNGELPRIDPAQQQRPRR